MRVQVGAQTERRGKAGNTDSWGVGRKEIDVPICGPHFLCEIITESKDDSDEKRGYKRVLNVYYEGHQKAPTNVLETTDIRRPRSTQMDNHPQALQQPGGKGNKDKWDICLALGVQQVAKLIQAELK